MKTESKNKTRSKGHISAAWQAGVVASVIMLVPCICVFSTEFKKGCPLTIGSSTRQTTFVLFFFLWSL